MITKKNLQASGILKTGDDYESEVLESDFKFSKDSLHYYSDSEYKGSGLVIPQNILNYTHSDLPVMTLDMLIKCIYHR